MNYDPLNPFIPFAVVVNYNPTQLTVLSGLVSKAGLEPRAYVSAEAALKYTPPKGKRRTERPEKMTCALSQ